MKKFVATILILSFFSLVSTNLVLFSQKEDSLTQIEDDMLSLNLEELQILDELFQLEQDIVELENESLILEGEIESLKKDVKVIEEEIETLDLTYRKNLDLMELFLQNYQKTGPLSNLQLILSSENLNMVLSRLNSIRELSKGVNSLLNNLEKDRDILSEQKLKRENTLLNIRERRAQLETTKSSKKFAVDNLENKLSSLKEDRTRYEKYLEDIDLAWKKTKPEFAQTISMISEIVENGDLPTSLVNLKYSFTGINAKIYSDAFNKALNEKNLPTQVDIQFEKDKMTLRLPKLNIFLSGNLELIDDTSLQFNIEDGKYLDLTLGQSSIEYLFDKDYLKFNFKTILMGNTIESLKTNKGNIDLLLNTIFNKEI